MIEKKLKYDAIMVAYFINEETRKTAFFSNFDAIIVVGFGKACLRLMYHSSRYFILFYYLISVHNYKTNNLKRNNLKITAIGEHHACVLSSLLKLHYAK